MRPKAEWAIDSEPIRAQGIIVKQAELKHLLVFFRINVLLELLVKVPCKGCLVHFVNITNNMS